MKKAPESSTSAPKSTFIDAMSLKMSGNLQEALNTAREAFESASDLPPLVSLIGALLYDLGKHQEAVDFYEGLSDEQREWADIIRIAKSMLVLGLNERIISLYAEVPEDHKKKLLPSLAEAYSRPGIRDEAVKFARQAVQARLEHSAGIVAAFEEDVSNNPNNPDTWFCLAAAREVTGNIQGAIAALEKAIELDPNDPVFRRALTGLQTKTSGSGN